MAPLSTKQQRAIEVLLLVPSLAQAAQQCGVSVRTLRRWRQLPAFAAALAEARREAVQVALTALPGACAEAVLGLRAVLQDPAASAPAKVAAAKTVLELTLKLTELEVLKERIAELETTLQQQQEAPPWT